MQKYANLVIFNFGSFLPKDAYVNVVYLIPTILFLFRTILYYERVKIGIDIGQKSEPPTEKPANISMKLSLIHI